MLCTHPRIERLLYKEVSENITDELLDDPVALFEVIKTMKYAHAVYVYNVSYF